MELIINIVGIIILIVFLFYFILGCKRGYIIDSIVIASLYPTIATMLGQEIGKTLISLMMYVVVVFIAIKRRVRYKYLQRKKDLISFSYFYIFLIYLVFNALFSPALGYDYFNTKIIFSIIEIAIPIIIMHLFWKSSFLNIEFLFRFFKTLSLLISLLLLINAYNIGIANIISATFMERVSVGDINVIWLGRFISVGLILIILKNDKLYIKLPSLALVIIAMILTGSKAVILFPFIVIVLYTFFFKKEKKVNRTKLILIMGIAIGLIFYLISFLNPEAVTRRFTFESNTITERQSFIHTVWNAYWSNNSLVFGNGFATSGFPLVHNYNQVSYPHNITIEILFEMGILGLFLIYLFLLTPFILLMKNRKFIKSNVIIVMMILFLFILFSQSSGSLKGNSFMFILSGYACIVLYDGKISKNVIQTLYR